MSDLIDRQKAIDAARDWYEGLICGSFKGLEKRLLAIQSAQPDVLACGSGELVQESDSLVQDCISRQEAIDSIAHATFDVTIGGRRGFQNYKEEFEKAFVAIMNKHIEALKALPSAEPERKKGKWVPVTNGRGGFECENCHHYAPSYQDGVEWLSDYCPYCGAKMDERRYDE